MGGWHPPCGEWPGLSSPGPLFSAVYFRALVNFTHSIEYSPRLEDVNSEPFQEVSEAVVDTVSLPPPFHLSSTPSPSGADALSSSLQVAPGPLYPSAPEGGGLGSSFPPYCLLSSQQPCEVDIKA